MRLTRPSAAMSPVCEDKDDVAKKGRPVPSHAYSTTLDAGKPLVSGLLLRVHSTPCLQVEIGAGGHSGYNTPTFSLTRSIDEQR